MSTDNLTPDQIARLEALQNAAPLVGRKSEGAFKGVEPIEIGDVVDLAEYILKGTHPMERYYEQPPTLRTLSGQIIHSEGEPDDHDA